MDVEYLALEPEAISPVEQCGREILWPMQISFSCVSELKKPSK